MDSVDQTGVEDHLLARYIEAFETSDHDIIRRLVHDDFSLEITPAKTWYQGVATCIPFLQRHALASPGDWRMLPTRVNGQPAAISYLRDDNGRYSASGFCVLTVGEGKLRRANVFKDPSLVTAAGYPMYLPG
jgi:RNA polymerase sigma-70 factor (ECF subfamily)